MNQDLNLEESNESRDLLKPLFVNQLAWILHFLYFGHNDGSTHFWILKKRVYRCDKLSTKDKIWNKTWFFSLSIYLEKLCFFFNKPSSLLCKFSSWFTFACYSSTRLFLRDRFLVPIASLATWHSSDTSFCMALLQRADFNLFSQAIILEQIMEYTCTNW